MGLPAVASCYGWAHDREIIEVDPIAEIPAPKEPRNPTLHTVTAADFDRLIASITGDDPLAHRDSASCQVLWSDRLSPWRSREGNSDRRTHHRHAALCLANTISITMKLITGRDRYNHA
jgi:hypothetical protein